MREVEEKLLEWLKVERDPRLEFIVRTLVSSMKSVCEKCMEERDINIFEPLCEERGYLNILIEAGVPKEYLPRFCFKRRGTEITRFLSKKPNPLPVRDANYYLSDFLDLFSRNLRRYFEKGDYNAIINYLKQKLEEFWGEVSFFRLSKGFICLILGKFESLILIDPTRNIVRINVEKSFLFTADDYIEFLEKALKLVKIEYKVIQLIEGEFFLRIELNNTKDLPEETLEKLKEHGLLSVKVSNGKTHLLFKLIDPMDTVPPFDLANVLGILKIMTNLSGGNENG
ncbi:MAG: hypothetical protein ACTSX9_09425 [Candidatus Njordarchaeales archaeon]